jgi:hypothetical protein
VWCAFGVSAQRPASRPSQRRSHRRLCALEPHFSVAAACSARCEDAHCCASMLSPCLSPPAAAPCASARLPRTRGAARPPRGRLVARAPRGASRVVCSAAAVPPPPPPPRAAASPRVVAQLSVAAAPPPAASPRADVPLLPVAGAASVVLLLGLLAWRPWVKRGCVSLLLRASDPCPTRDANPWPLGFFLAGGKRLKDGNPR